MTDQYPNETTPPAGDPFADEPIPEGTPDAFGTDQGGPSARGREWLAQLETMINDIATQAAPVARQVAAKAAELTAVAAVKAGPIAHKAAEVTTDAGQRLAERAQTLASDLRGETGTNPVDDAGWSDGTSGSSSPETMFEDRASTDDETRTTGL